MANENEFSERNRRIIECQVSIRHLEPYRDFYEVKQEIFELVDQLKELRKQDAAVKTVVKNLANNSTDKKHLFVKKNK